MTVVSITLQGTIAWLRAEHTGKSLSELSAYDQSVLALCNMAEAHHKELETIKIMMKSQSQASATLSDALERIIVRGLRRED